MMDGPNPSRQSGAHPGEEGYVMLVAIFLMALVVISLGIAAPKIAKSIQRDRDLETFHRGMQYRRAVQLYYRKFHAYPPNADALVQTNNIRFLRKKYIDPSTGKDDWKPVMFGQNKTPTAMGFFGQPLSGGASSIAGIGPGGGNSAMPGTNGTGSAFGGSSFGGSSFGGSSFGGSSFGGSSFGGSSSGGSNSIFGSSSSDSSSTGSSSTGSTDNSGGTGTDNSGSGSGSSGATTGSSGSGSTSSGTGTGLTGQTFGGAGIIGFSPASPKQSILVYKKKDHYNEWEFTYDPISEMKTIGGGNTGTIGQPASSTTSPIGSSSFGNSSFGNSGFGNSGLPNPNPPSMPPETSAPQQ